jgi:hypothetical protein
MQRFRLALDLLGPDQPADNRALRFERAQAHFLVARRPGPGGPGGPAGGPGGPPGPERPGGERPGERWRAEVQQQLTAAQAILGDLLREEPQNPDFRALQARCLLESGRRRARGGDRDRQAAIEIFRQLVAELPQAEQYAYELCEALWSDGRPFRPDDATAVQASIDSLREAAEHARRLVEQQPNMPEYAGLRARIRSSLARQLLRLAEADPAHAEATRREAEVELRAALVTEDDLAANGQVVDVRLRFAAIGTRSALTLLLLDTDRTDAARAEAELMLSALRRLATASDDRHVPRGERLDEVELVARRLARADLAAELRRLRDQLPGEPDGPPPRRR